MDTLSKQDRAAGLQGREIGGRFRAVYDAGKALEIIEQVSLGKTIVEITSQPGMPTRQTFYRWVAMDPELERVFTTARELSALSLEEEALDMARVLKNPNEFTGTKVRAFEVAMAQFRWSASRRDPKRYGTTVAPSLVVPIHINTTLDLAGGKSVENVYTLDLSAKVPEQAPEPTMLEDAEAADPTDEEEATVAPSPQPQTSLSLPDPFEVPASAPPKTFASKPRGRPVGSKKGHKTPAQLRATMAAHQKREINAARKAEKGK